MTEPQITLNLTALIVAITGAFILGWLTRNIICDIKAILKGENEKW